MSKVDTLPARSGIAMHPAILVGLLFAAAAALTWRHLSGFLPATAWLPALWRPEIADTAADAGALHRVSANGRGVAQWGCSRPGRHRLPAGAAQSAC